MSKSDRKHVRRIAARIDDLEDARRLLVSECLDHGTEIGYLQRQDMANRTRISAAGDALIAAGQVVGLAGTAPGDALIAAGEALKLAGTPVDEANDAEAVAFGKLYYEENSTAGRRRPSDELSVEAAP